MHSSTFGIAGVGVAAFTASVLYLAGLGGGRLQGPAVVDTATKAAAAATTADDCARACSDCQRACDKHAAQCSVLMARGKGQYQATIALASDCADLCTAAARITARDGVLIGMACRAAGEACGKCAASCEGFPADAAMKACAMECRRCENACLDMLKQVVDDAAGK